MFNPNSQKVPYYQPKQSNLLYPIAVLWGTFLLLVITYIIYDSISYNTQDNLYLIPWCILSGVVFLAPSAYLYYKKEFNPFHPLVLPVWTYFFPAFSIGGLILALGWSQPYFLAFVQNERFNLPLTLVYISLGFLFLTIGFYFPYSKRIGTYVGDKLPEWDWEPNKLFLPGLFLLALGFLNTILAFGLGIIGYQDVAESGVFDGLLFLVTFFWLEASFLLWLCIFRSDKLNINHYLVIGILLGTSLLKSAFQGNRGSLMQIFVLIAFAFVMSGRKILLKHKILAVSLLTGAIVFGMIYGTTFRSIKNKSDQVSAQDYAGMIMQTFERISEQDTLKVLQKGFASLAERIESVSSLAVVVSNYEKLHIYESGYGLDNNILKDSVTFLIPRFLWKDKPVATDPASYGDLYFNFSDNSFTITPVGDLLRNFGPWGIPIGMLILGFLLRIIYSGLVEGRIFSFWRITIFYMILATLSYEGSYGLIVPYGIKVVGVSILGLLIIRFIVGSGKPNNSTLTNT